ncbi:hypothetical protein M426DRAFT_316823 [Hypoxylon sp. CI-4A]|nr:hypothetical protein M426DRAFT_316823 [Hypoxylon sp. CI-4A]
MDLQLKEKIEFFEYLKDSNFENGDALGAREEAHRQRSRAFFSDAKKASAKPLFASQKEITQSLDTASSKAVSGPVPAESDSEVEIIAVTPLNANPKPNRPSLRTSTSVADDNIIVPETVTAPTEPPPRRSTRSRRATLKLRDSSPQSDLSPSVRMGKRKKDAPLKMAPEAQQVFKGLSFYYIPNDDIDPARKMRIKRAREHGAEWCRKLVNATHIIVDKKLTYVDIERHLHEDSKWSEKVLVTDNYPLDCLRHRIIANPNQSQYKITGMPTSIEQPSNASSPRGPPTSPQLKPRRKKTGKRTSVPLSNTQSTNEAPSQTSADLIPSSRPHSIKSITTNIQTAEPEADNDDLTQCIQDLKTAGGNNSLHDALLGDGDSIGPWSSADEADPPSDSSSSSNERPRKRRTRSRDDSARGKDTDWQEKFICMKGGTKDREDNGPNAETIKVLQEMLEVHTLAGDNFRIRAYRLAITTLRAQKKKIRTAEEARALPHIGRIAEKIEEIVNTNRLRQLEYAQDDPRRKVIALFLKIYGVGQSQAEKWIAQGYRTLDDLRSKAELSVNQKIGLDHFDDLNTRIPRQEMDVLAKCVKKSASAIDRSVDLIVGGSYRRGADNSGDIDFIITKRGTSSTSELVPFLNRLIDTLTEEGFLTAELAAHQADDNGGSKWHGCCVLPKRAFPGPKEEYRPIWRRIDLLLVPETEIGAALIYFTGNDIFNRSIRLLARKKKMRLNQRGLFSDVLRGPGSTRMTAGTLLEGRDEKRIFEILGVRWREPHERWCG